MQKSWDKHLIKFYCACHAGTIRCESTDFMAKLLNGFYHPFGAPLGMPFADIDDVAAAHCLALATPEADGR